MIYTHGKTITLLSHYILIDMRDFYVLLIFNSIVIFNLPLLIYFNL